MLNLSPQYLKDLCAKAKFAFNKCIADPENDFLQDEIKIPLGNVILLEEFVRLKFVNYEIDRFEIEVKLALASPDGSLIGMYLYYEDERGLVIDDMLVFD